jgi:DNA-binding transcriptional ArsR family regulator
LKVSVTEQRRELTIQELREIARYFHALRDVLRLRILITLAERGEMTVTELAQTLRVSQPLISFHLNPLRVLELVQVRRVGREVYCSVNLSEIRRRQDEFMQVLAGPEV